MNKETERDQEYISYSSEYKINEHAAIWNISKHTWKTSWKEVAWETDIHECRGIK
jgi:hypothetical protein